MRSPRFLILCVSLLAIFNVSFAQPKFVYTAVNTFSNCPHAVPSNHPNFCNSFANVAKCHCTEAGLPGGMCSDVNAIYNRMIAIFGNQRKACQYQKDTSVQECMDDWNCYRLGGKNSLAQLCSNSGRSCKT